MALSVLTVIEINPETKMKNTLRILMLALITAAASPSVFAFDLPPVNVPDGGATGLFICIGVAGLAVGKRIFRKK